MTAAGFGYLCALLLAAVFAVAAATKLRDPTGTGRSFAELGVPRAATLARAVPIAEALIALALVGLPPLGGLAALVSLAFFTTFLVGRLRAGVRAPCSCFGSVGQAPLSPANLVGNAFLMALALAALVPAGPTLPALVDGVVLVIVIGVEVAIHTFVRRQVGTPARS